MKHRSLVNLPEISVQTITSLYPPIGNIWTVYGGKVMSFKLDKKKRDWKIRVR